ncbi:hypothetical protein GCM10025859_47940 [Alicyclobacillus fastidiosus]|nr:hypothetical protein GCM10025859_47940 [Alicyclobacillus fastidiosus]
MNAFLHFTLIGLGIFTTDGNKKCPKPYAKGVELMGFTFYVAGIFIMSDEFLTNRCVPKVPQH